MRGKLKGVKKVKGKGPARMVAKNQKRKQALKAKPAKKGAKLVSVADFIHNEKVKEEEEVLEEQPNGDEDPAPSQGVLRFARNLAHTEKAIRDRGFKTLGKFLKAKTTLGSSQYLKIWKGLYMCIWMTDKLPVQAHVAQKMANLIHQIPKEETLKFVNAFWQIIARQWSILDRLRMDKIYRLMRCMIKESFVFLKAENWDAGVVKAYTTLLSKGPLSNQSNVGIIGHICDVYIEELQRTIEEDLSPSLGVLVLEPFIQLLAKIENKITFKRVTDAIFDRLTGDSITYKLYRNEIQKGTKEYRFFPDVALLSARFFETAGLSSTCEGSRKKLYALSNKFKNTTPPPVKTSAKKLVPKTEVPAPQEVTPEVTKEGKSEPEKKPQQKSKEPQVADAKESKKPEPPKADPKPSKKETVAPQPQSAKKEAKVNGTNHKAPKAEEDEEDDLDDEDFSDMVDLDTLGDLDEALDNMDEEEIKLVEEEVKRVLEKKQAANADHKRKRSLETEAPASLPHTPEPKAKKVKAVQEVINTELKQEAKQIKGILSPRMSPRQAKEPTSAKKNVTISTENNKIKKFIVSHPPKVVATTPESSPYLNKKKKREFVVQDV